MEIKRIKITDKKGFIITREWFQDAWRYKAKKHTLHLFGSIWIPGWNDENSIFTTVEYFNSVNDAESYIERIKKAYLQI